MPGSQNQTEKLRAAATAIFQAGIQAVSPETCIRRHLCLSGDHLQVGGRSYPLGKTSRLFLIGAGKASAAMAEQAEEILGDRIHKGLVITKYDHGKPLKYCAVMEGGHPVPDVNGEAGADALLDLVSTAGPDDLILCMISGGASALTPAPAKGISLTDKRETTRLLLACGASIHEINTIRKHLSRIKGGRLCRASNHARMISLILSDVIGDDLDMIGSGMTAPDRGTFQDCYAILNRYGLWGRVPEPVQARLAQGMEGRVRETPKPGSPEFDRVQNQIVGCLAHALKAAAQKAQALGFQPLILSSMIQGEAKEAAKVLCAIAKEVSNSSNPLAAPACLLSGGETTVTLKADGKGGRNTEFALAAGIALAGENNILLLSAGTDGSDGPTDAAGAFADHTTLDRAAQMGLSALDALNWHDSYRLFEPLGDLFITGPTQTNVMDLQIFLME